MTAKYFTPVRVWVGNVKETFWPKKLFLFSLLLVIINISTLLKPQGWPERQRRNERGERGLKGDFAAVLAAFSNNLISFSILLLLPLRIFLWIFFLDFLLKDVFLKIFFLRIIFLRSFFLKLIFLRIFFP